MAVASGMSEYCVDVVLCIDATGSMTPILKEVKKNASSLYELFLDRMEMEGKQVDALRLKVITFRDFLCDAQPLTESPFFDLSLEEDSKGFCSYVEGIRAYGGGDDPENALEAIACALDSDWTTDGAKRRHVVVVFSDAPALPLGARAGCKGYPLKMPTSMTRLSARWEGTDGSFKGSYQPEAGRLIAFVPKHESWKSLESWSRSTLAYTAGKGCADKDMQAILDTIVGSF